MLLGDLIERFHDPAVVSETLLSIGDLALAARVNDAAASESLTLGGFAERAIDRFVAQAGDDDWLAMMGILARSDCPGEVFLRRVLWLAVVRAPCD